MSCVITTTAKAAVVISEMPMNRLARLAYSGHRDAQAAYDEMERRAAQAGGWAALHRGRGLVLDVQRDCGDIGARPHGPRTVGECAAMTALGRPWKGTYKRTGLPNFVDAKNLSPFLNKELMDVLEPVEFINLR